MNQKVIFVLAAGFTLAHAVCVRAVGTASNGLADTEIVVTATRTTQSVRDLPVSMEVVDQTALRTRDPLTVDQLFRTVAGADLQSSGLPGSAARLNLRGLTDGYQSVRLLVLMDGRRINDPYVGNVEFGLLPVDAVERVEILRGPASSIYGSSALAGVVNITTRRGTAEPITECQLEGGNYGTWLGRVAHGAKRGNVDYFVNASRVQTDGYMRNSDGTRRNWEAVNFLGNVGISGERDAELRAHFGSYDGNGTDENSRRETTRDYQMLEYRHREPAELIARLFRNGQRDLYDWKYPGEGVYRQEVLAGDLQQSLWLSARHYGTAGVEIRGEQAHIEEVTGQIKESTTVGGIYVQDQWWAAEAWRFTGGLRHDRDEDYGGEWSPRVGATWLLREWAEAYAAMNRAYRAPSLSDRFADVEYNGARFVGNSALRPEHLTAWEVGCRIRAARTLRLNLAAFHNELEDSFDFVRDPDGVFRNRNVTRSHTAGIEAGAEWQIAAPLKLTLNYSHTDGEYDRGPQPDIQGKRLAYLAPDKAAIDLEYSAGRLGSHAFTGRYVDSRYGDAQNTSANRMDAYITLDWYSRVPVGKRAAINVKVNNLLDADYEELPHVPQPGRFLLAGLQVSF